MEKVADILFKTLAWLGFVCVFLLICGGIWLFMDQFSLTVTFICFSIVLTLFTLAIVFRKEIKGGIFVALIYASILSVVLNGLVYAGAVDYLSHYSKDKWIKYANHRYYMLEDLQKEHDLVGLSENEVKNLLGEPAKVVDRIDGYYAYEYSTGGRYLIDPYVLEIVFLNGTSTYVTAREH